MSTRINPATGDYVQDDTGGFETADDHRNAVTIALTVEKGSVMGAAEVGSELHTLANGKISGGVLVRADDMVRSALAPLTNAGTISLEDVAVELVGNLLAIEVSYRVGEVAHRFSHFVRVS